MTDVPNMALVGAAGLDALTGALPLLTQSDLAGLTGLTFRTTPLRQDVTLAGPLSLDLTLSTTTPDSGIWVVLTDVAPDGTNHPLTVGRLSTSYPGVVAGKSRVDADGDIVQPYGDYSHKDPAKPLAARRYHVELWPVGNKFEAGHRIGVQIVGTSAASMPSLPALHTVRLGGSDGARLYVPVLPGSDLGAALAS
jgi:predicted acyl esterase